MDKNIILDVIKYNYINQLKSLNYNTQNKYPITWNKNTFVDSILDIKKQRNKFMKDEYTNAIITGLNLINIEENTYKDALEQLTKNTRINIIELENILKQYIETYKDTPSKLNPVNAFLDENLIKMLNMILNGFAIPTNYTYSFFSPTLPTPVQSAPVQPVPEPTRGRQLSRTIPPSKPLNLANAFPAPPLIQPDRQSKPSTRESSPEPEINRNLIERQVLTESRGNSRERLPDRQILPVRDGNIELPSLSSLDKDITKKLQPERTSTVDIPTPQTAPNGSFISQISTLPVQNNIQKPDKPVRGRSASPEPEINRDVIERQVLTEQAPRQRLPERQPLQEPIIPNRVLPELTENEQVKRTELTETNVNTNTTLQPQNISLLPINNEPAPSLNTFQKPPKPTRGRTTSPEPEINRDVIERQVSIESGDKTRERLLEKRKVLTEQLPERQPLPTLSETEQPTRKELDETNINIENKPVQETPLFIVGLSKLKKIINLIKAETSTNLSNTKNINNNYKNAYENILKCIDALKTNNFDSYNLKKAIVTLEKSTIENVTIINTISTNISLAKDALLSILSLKDPEKQTIIDNFFKLDSEMSDEFKKLIPNIPEIKDEILKLLEELRITNSIHQNVIKSFNKLKELLQSAYDKMNKIEENYKNLDIYQTLIPKIESIIKDVNKEIIELEKDTYIEYVKRTLPKINKLVQYSSNEMLTSILPLIKSKYILGDEETYLEIKRIEQQLHGSGAKVNVADEANYKVNVPKILNEMISEYLTKYEKSYKHILELKERIRKYEKSIEDSKQKIEDILKEINYDEVIRQINELFTEDTKIYESINTYTVFAQSGGNDINTKELLYNAVSAYLLCKNEHANTFKSLILNQIKSNLKTKNKISCKIPRVNELLKMIALPLYCNNNGINVTYNNMNKCVKRNMHKLLSSDQINEYVKQLDFDNRDKLILKEYDRRVKQIVTIVNSHQ